MASETAETGGFDRIEAPMDDGEIRAFTRAEFAALPLAERIRILVEGKARFFRNGESISARDALRDD